MEMYELKVKNSVFTIPKENIGLLAYTKAKDMGKTIDPRNREMAIQFLESIGIQIKERNYEK